MALSVEENPYLEEIVDRFTEMRRTDRPIPVWCFYETRPSRISKTLLNNPNVKDVSSLQLDIECTVYMCTNNEREKEIFLTH